MPSLPSSVPGYSFLHQKSDLSFLCLRQTFGQHRNDANLVKSHKTNTGAACKPSNTFDPNLTDEQINKNELGLDNGVTLNIRVLTSVTQFPIS
jgi:hypothetical protein